MTELELKEMRIRGKLNKLLEIHKSLPALSVKQREKLVRMLLKVNGEQPDLVDLRVIYRYTARGFLGV